MTEAGTTRRHLSEEECRALLGSTSRGHLAFTRDALPAISPVHYALDGDRVVIPARPDSDHLPPAGGAVVVLGADGCSGDDEWAVTIVGPARTVADVASVGALQALDWTGRSITADGRRFVVLTIGVLRGWRTTRVPGPSSRRPA
ncbi:hypothetical protein GCM10027451_20050 [Geodermatophilus aquaeductus]|uniref:Pyridoxamine 5'-phosphate oxidase n=1 Tax=Geodermatophilus aquaeductus TaxID=1564161 RepID=A0A521EBE4_9ACTN|nr:pyridoxamine 5'-phosphate oxidase family protein [Geodermatophilus aquaeductus]SMO81245.1 Pyridoxamine 5'-phosphate oxidase [Geodermatophilus aquaeductus]